MPQLEIKAPCNLKLRNSWWRATEKRGMIYAEVRNMTIGQRICELRKERGYSQEYVAERLDVTRQAVSKWETDLSAPDTYNLIALAELFGVSVEYIATGKGEDTTPPAPERAQVGRTPLTMRQIAGLVFMTVCLLSSMLAIVLQTPVLLVFSTALLIGTIVLLVNAKHAALICLWAQWVLTSIALAVINGTPTFAFSLFVRSSGAQVSRLEIVCLGYWLWFLVNVVWTVRVLWKRKKN